MKKSVLHSRKIGDVGSFLHEHIDTVEQFAAFFST